MKLARALMLLAAAGAMYAQSWDTSGNSMLNGKYYFRQVFYVPDTSYAGYLDEAVTIYGNIEFDGNGNYSITANDLAQYIDYSYYYSQVEAGGAFPATTGTYSIAASGYGFISNPYDPTDSIYGLVSKQGIFVGSTTDNVYGYNDMMVAAPLASPAPTASSFTGSWTCSDLDMSSGESPYAESLLFGLSPDGNGNLNAGTITGYVGGVASLYTQSASGLKYTFSNGAAVATFPTNGTLISGQKYFYFSKDGSFMFGGSPITSNTPFDMIVGVKSGATPALSGLYYQAGVDVYPDSGDQDSYFGSFNVIAGAAPQTYLGHERINDYGGSSVVDYTYNDTISLSGNTFSNTYARYVVGAGGAVEITSGIGAYLGLSVALQAPTPTGSGVFLNPTGVVNSASDAPFTASIAPGELLTVYGSNLADATQVAGIPFPMSLGNVQVNIGGLPAPIYYVSSGQISAIVPYGVTIGSIAQIQVINDMGSSNIVTDYVAATAPGVFTQNQNGTGYGEIEHLGIGNSSAPPGSIVSSTYPALMGESLAVYLTGLGTVSPAISDGAPGPATTLSNTTNTIAVDFDGTAGTNDFAGLAPGYSGLYQLNVTVPTTGLTVGPNFLDIAGPDSYMSYVLVPIAAASSSSETANARTAADTAPPRVHRRAQPTPSLRNPVPRKPFGALKKPGQGQ
jgi:uncharacterized protein (TIGR03437 family)